MNYSCRIDGEVMLCVITADRDLNTPTFCFSGMGPMLAVDGGMTLKTVGSYTEVALPNLRAGEPHSVTIKYDGEFIPANRAWMPLGPYLRVDGEVLELPPTEAGVNTDHLGKTEPFDGLRIVPQPTSFEPANDTISATRFASNDPAFAAVHDLAVRRGFGGFADKAGHQVEFVEENMATDAYRLEISADRITVFSSSYGGRFYAGITLLTLVNMHNGTLPCGTVTDTPRFTWRGQHLDTARHFYEPQTILDLLDLMALLKMNRFHWHFADDEAFRLQIDCLPELWQQTETRGEGHLMPALFAGGPESGGSYSKPDAQKIIAHAAALNIEVMPEIECPAHALAIAHVYPEVRDPADNGAETSVQGYKGNVLNPAMPKTWEIVEAIAKEVGELFPFGHLHLGCDELPKDTWMGSPKARALMAEHGLETTQDLQGWMMEKLAQVVVRNGQRPAAWEEAAQGKNGGIGNNAILFTWTGQGPGLEAARAGYDVVMAPAQHVYLDMAWSKSTDDWGANWAAYVSLDDTINWEPVPEVDLKDRIIGVQGEFWSEFTTEDSQLWPMLVPRILGVASKAWQEQDIHAKDLRQIAGHYRDLPLGLGDTD
ncbi:MULTISPECIES: beta-N-acetylhexosaminidase [Halocynthiibacter]|uniref:beta-N-acetylhexosaminidase n=1 Tax=Halocynthiibacter halioticoli TaxID=2986804 RepID=A0AAE3J1F8_9RHOB|nr:MULTISPECIES: beta-N-acetylhexosaminidase [Halocynthiibacter]MCV6824796.1 beta-N-acetylhexosaminidase [Halocynthiibacter halioticoli]MCW4057797.1 beta-N-acetylhexosaminidase [Halocynthiibacter sp. SDUM655004]